MGQYLSNGIISSFKIKKRENPSWSYSYDFEADFDLKNELDDILKELNKYIDTSLYEISASDDNYYIFSLKKDVFKDNIHDLLIEMSKITYPNSIGYDYSSGGEIDVNDREFAKKNPFTLEFDSEGEIFIKGANTEDKEQYIGEQYWLLRDKRLKANIIIYVCFILLWRDFDKYIGEDETNMLFILNNMKTTYFKTKLSRALIFCVF